MKFRKICIVGLDAYGLLSGEGDLRYIGGETVQHVLLARAWRDLHHGLNMRLDVLSMVADGDTVVVRLRESGKWTGPFLDFKQPTGHSYELLAIEWFELSDGKIARRWGARDGGSQARQLGFPGSASHCPAAKEDRPETA